MGEGVRWQVQEVFPAAAGSQGRSMIHHLSGRTIWQGWGGGMRFPVPVTDTGNTVKGA